MSPKSLSRILAVKQRLQQMKKSELARANASVDAASRHFDQISALRAATARAVAEAGEIDAAELAVRAEVAEFARRDLSRARHALEERNRERDAHKEHVVEATREVRVMETLQERMQRHEWRERMAREQSELDESAARRRPPT